MTYKNDLIMRSRITKIEKKLQVEVVVYSLDGHSSCVKEKIQVGIGDKLDGNRQGINELIKFWIAFILTNLLTRKSLILSFILCFDWLPR